MTYLLTKDIYVGVRTPGSELSASGALVSFLDLQERNLQGRIRGRMRPREDEGTMLIGRTKTVPEYPLQNSFQAWVRNGRTAGSLELSS